MSCLSHEAPRALEQMHVEESKLLRFQEQSTYTDPLCHEMAEVHHSSICY